MESIIKPLVYIGIIFLAIALKQAGVFGKDDYRILSRIVMNITLPLTVVHVCVGFRPEPSMYWLCLLYTSNHIAGTAARPRLAVFRSNSHMYAQIIDDTVGHTLVSASTLQKDVKAELEKTNDVKAAAYLGTVIGKKAVEAGIKEVVFDRGGFIYQGKIQALADAAREAGLEF